MASATTVKRAVRGGVPSVLLAGALLPGPRRRRQAAAAALVSFWLAVHAVYRARGRARAETERAQLAATDWDAFRRHYAHVPTVEEELDLWGDYDRHRHEMRYRLVAGEAARHLPPGGRVVDVGCGSAKVADELAEVDASYVGLDFGSHQIAYAVKKQAARAGGGRLRVALAQSTAEELPVASATADVVVMTEVVEHLLRPELAVWEVARVLRPGGVLVLSTNNACEMPVRSPLSHPLAWAEKALGWTHPGVVSNRPWVWPEEIDPGSPARVPHTHHLPAETTRLLAAAGLTTEHVSTFEFPPAHGLTARWLGRRGDPGLRLVDVLEEVCRRTPLLDRMGTHLFVVARRTGEPVAAEPPPGVWPGPLSA